MLNIEVDDEYVIEADSDIDTVIAALSVALDIKFDLPDTQAHGYPTYRARLGTELNPDWVFLSPNTVRRGFVRSNDTRYEQLKDLLPGYAPRYPELPDSSYLLYATNGVPSTFMEACARMGVIVRPLREYFSEL